LLPISFILPLQFSVTVCDLGVTLDQELTFAPHIQCLCCDSYYWMCQLRPISRSLTSRDVNIGFLIKPVIGCWNRF